MKSRHRKNKSLVNEHSYPKPYSHCRSFSYNRQPQSLKPIQIPQQSHAPEIFPTDSITLPLSTEHNREVRNGKKMSPKDNSQQLHRDKRPVKSRDKESKPRKPKMKSRPMKGHDSPSNHRGDKSDRKMSK